MTETEFARAVERMEYQLSRRLTALPQPVVVATAWERLCPLCGRAASASTDGGPYLDARDGKVHRGNPIVQRYSCGCIVEENPA